MNHAIHHGEHHVFEAYEKYPHSDWCTYTTDDGRRYGIESGLIGSDFNDAVERYVSKSERMVEYNVGQARDAVNNAEVWAKGFPFLIRKVLLGQEN